MSKKGSFGQIEDVNYTNSQRVESVEEAISDVITEGSGKLELEKAKATEIRKYI